MSGKLAIDGGAPVRTSPLRAGFLGASEIGEPEIEAVSGVLRSQKLFRHLLEDDESYAARLEAAYRERLGLPHALAVSGGTSALIAGLVGLGIGVGDEVIVPAYTYIATAAAVLSVGAIPVIAEIDETLTLDPDDLERHITPLTKAIIPVHMRGIPAQMDRITAVAQRHGLKVLEDVAQANGGAYRGKPLGAWGDAGAFSFQQYKVITSGEGGMLVTADRSVYERAACKCDSAKTFWMPGDDAHSFAGENMRMCELRAALGYVQLGRLDEILSRTRRLKRRIVEQLMGVPGIEAERSPDPEGDCGLAAGFFLPTAAEAQRFARALAAEGIECGTTHSDGIPDRHIYTNWHYVLNKGSADRTGFPWSPRYYSGHVEYARDMCPRSLDFLNRNVVIQVGHRWSDQDADDVAEAVLKVARAYY